MPAEPVALTSSAGMPSRPGDFPVLSLFTAFSTADRSGGGSYSWGDLFFDQ